MALHLISFIMYLNDYFILLLQFVLQGCILDFTKVAINAVQKFGENSFEGILKYSALNKIKTNIQISILLFTQSQCNTKLGG